MLQTVRHPLSWVVVSLVVLPGIAGAAEVSDSWSGTYQNTFYDIYAGAEFPIQVEPGTDFEITITASCNRTYWYSLREDAQWNYVDETSHLLEFTDGGTIHELDWHYRQPYVKTFTFNLPEGTYHFTFYVEAYGAHHAKPGVAVDFDVVVESACDLSVAGIDEYIQALPTTTFKNNKKSRKNTLGSKLGVVQAMIDDGRCDEARDKLVNDIRGKVDGVGKNDWITDPIAREEILAMIDTLVECLSECP